MVSNPEELLREVTREAKRLASDVDDHQASPPDVHRAIDRLVEVAGKVGEVLEHEEVCDCCVLAPGNEYFSCSRRDRLLRELSEVGK